MMSAASFSCGVVSVAAAPVRKFPGFRAVRQSVWFFSSFYPLFPVFASGNLIASPAQAKIKTVLIP